MTAPATLPPLDENLVPDADAVSERRQARARMNLAAPPPSPKPSDPPQRPTE